VGHSCIIRSRLFNYDIVLFDQTRRHQCCTIELPRVVPTDQEERRQRQVHYHVNCGVMLAEVSDLTLKDNISWDL
jgi:hypothetical protein